MGLHCFFSMSSILLVTKLYIGAKYLTNKERDEQTIIQTDKNMYDEKQMQTEKKENLK